MQWLPWRIKKSKTNHLDRRESCVRWRTLVTGERFINLVPEEWANIVASFAVDHAKELFAKGVTTDEMMIWQKGHNKRHKELFDDLVQWARDHPLSPEKID